MANWWRNLLNLLNIGSDNQQTETPQTKAPTEAKPPTRAEIKATQQLDVLADNATRGLESSYWLSTGNYGSRQIHSSYWSMPDTERAQRQLQEAGIAVQTWTNEQRTGTQAPTAPVIRYNGQLLVVDAALTAGLEQRLLEQLQTVLQDAPWHLQNRQLLGINNRSTQHQHALVLYPSDAPTALQELAAKHPSLKGYLDRETAHIPGQNKQGEVWVLTPQDTGIHYGAYQGYSNVGGGELFRQHYTQAKERTIAAAVAWLNDHSDELSYRPVYIPNPPYGEFSTLRIILTDETKRLLRNSPLNDLYATQLSHENNVLEIRA